MRSIGSQGLHKASTHKGGISLSRMYPAGDQDNVFKAVIRGIVGNCDYRDGQTNETVC